MDSIKIDDLLKEVDFTKLNELLSKLFSSAKRSSRADKDSLLGNIESLQTLVAAAEALRRSITNLQMSYMDPTYVTSTLGSTIGGYTPSIAYRATEIKADFRCKDNLDQALVSWLFGYFKPGPHTTTSEPFSVSGGSSTGVSSGSSELRELAGDTKCYDFLYTKSAWDGGDESK